MDMASRLAGWLSGRLAVLPSCRPAVLLFRNQRARRDRERSRTSPHGPGGYLRAAAVNRDRPLVRGCRSRGWRLAVEAAVGSEPGLLDGTQPDAETRAGASGEYESNELIL